MKIPKKINIYITFFFFFFIPSVEYLEIKEINNKSKILNEMKLIKSLGIFEILLKAIFSMTF